MTHPHRTPLRAIAALALTSTVVLLAACGSAGTSSAAAPHSSASPVSTTATGGASGSTPQAQVGVAIKDYAFTPKTITVAAGGTVTWTNDDQFAHAISDGATGQDGSSDIAPQSTYSHTYPAAGTYPYVCGIHPNMKGTVIVK